MSWIQGSLDVFTHETELKSDADNSSTFVGNMKRPVHRWFRYAAGFSSEWVKQVIKGYNKDYQATVFDPFVGSGTTVLAAQECGVNAIGIESHPFIIRVAKAKLLWKENIKHFSDFSEEIIRLAKRQKGETQGYSRLIYDCYPEDVLRDLDSLRNAWLEINDESPSSFLCWLALTKILRECSPVGTSQMELIQPRKKKQNASKPFPAFIEQVSTMLKDMAFFQRKYATQPAEVHSDDARMCNLIPDDSISLVITSPPYINNYDYADACRLEMTFWGEIDSWGDLQEKVRRHLIRSCAQHMSYQKQQLDQLLDAKRLSPIIDDLSRVCTYLSAERLKHGGKKNYHLMTAAYFLDMVEVWSALRRVCRQPSRICFVVGDSAPYGIYVPVHEWLGRLSLAAGFRSYNFERLRDRNIKWHNRKHRVPLCEGRLWVDG